MRNVDIILSKVLRGGLAALFVFALCLGASAPAQAVPGTPCSPDDPSACDVCNSEQCELNEDADEFQCAILVDDVPVFDPAATANPCPVDGQMPGCWTGCVEVDIDGFEQAQCEPNDDFCNDISGGTTANECRVGACVDEVLNASNPSGCDYDLVPNADENCVLCISPEPVPFNHCGNGVCESPNETFENCAIDCRVPGFTGPLLEEGDPILVAACDFPEPQIVFNGPPFNEPGSLLCEDGDVCTDNVCVDLDSAEDACVITPKACEPDADFCCPAGCEPPTTGSCREVTGAPIPGCDPDCYVPVECPIITPTPTPTATPFNVLLEGSGCSLGALAGPASAWFWVAGLTALAGLGLKRRRG